MHRGIADNNYDINKEPQMPNEVITIAYIYADCGSWDVLCQAVSHELNLTEYRLYLYQDTVFM